MRTRKHISRVIGVLFLLWGVYGASLVQVAEAHNPRVIETPTQNEVMPLESPRISQAIYGTLEGYPHMYEFATRKQMELFVEVLEPDIRGARRNISGIILKVNLDGSVREVARLRAKEAKWESFFEPWGGDRYLRGGSFKAEIEPGLYRIEVSTPDNLAKYVLAVGTEENFEGVGYGALVRELVRVKIFFGKPAWRVVESPFVYGPSFILIAAIGILAWYIRRRRRTVV